MVLFSISEIANFKFPRTLNRLKCFLPSEKMMKTMCERRSTAVHLCSSLLFFFFLQDFSNAQTPLMEVESPYSPYSSSSPFSHQLRESPSESALVRRLFTIITTFANIIDHRVRDEHPRACNLHAPIWFNKLVDNVRDRYLPSLDSVCRTRLDGTDAQMSAELNRSFLHSISSILQDASHAIARVIQVDSGELYPLAGWSISRGSQQCLVHSVGAFRVDSVWYVRIAVTNNPVDTFVSNLSRVIYEEFSDVSFNNVVTTSFPNSSNVTTVMSTWRGKAPFSIAHMGVDENAAIVEALRLTEFAVNQAEDAITPSNLAILAFPLFLTFVPLAFIAELNDCATILYITFTDLFSALPLLIKGIELFLTGSQRHGDTSAYHVGNTTFSWLEIWSVQCTGANSFVLAGVILIVVSLSAVVLGLIVEYAAWRFMNARKKNDNSNKTSQDMKSPFGDIYHSDSWLTYDPFEKSEDNFDDLDYEDDYLQQSPREPIGSWGLHLLQPRSRKTLGIRQNSSFRLFSKR